MKSSYFFFSSRRRHTRYIGDWSSDVCSSDLASIPQSNTVLTGTTALVQDTRTFQAQYQQNWSFGLNAQMSYASQYTKLNSQFFNLNPYSRSEERRVGKEDRTRRSTEH